MADMLHKKYLGGRRRFGGEDEERASDGDGSAARMATARRRGRRPGLPPPAWEAQTRCQFQNTFGTSKLYYIIASYRSDPCPQAQATLIQTPAIWLKFSDKEPLPTGKSSARERGHPHPPQRTQAIWPKFCSDPDHCIHSLIRKGAEGRRWYRENTFWAWMPWGSWQQAVRFGRTIFHESCQALNAECK